MTLVVSVITPTIPERADLLRECELSVAAQTESHLVYEHLIEVDEKREGCSAVMNRLALRARGEWLLPFPDDDLLFPRAISALLDRSSEGDIVYGPPVVIGNSDTHFWGEPPEIPSFALVRRSLWMALGGYDESAKREEDRKLWTKALEAGATFVRIDEVVWAYRFHRDASGRFRNKSYNQGEAA